MNLLSNVFQGKDGDSQPWKKYYRGIKPKNPLGGDIVRRMGNKVKPVVSSVIGGKEMTFSHVGKLATFEAPLSKEEFLAAQRAKQLEEEEDEGVELPSAADTLNGFREARKQPTTRERIDISRDMRGRINTARGISQEIRGWARQLI